MGFSYSAITSARRCNKLYQYVYLDKLISPEPASGDMQFGQAIHMSIEAYLLGDNGQAQFEAFWGLEKDKNNAYSRFGWEELRDQGLRLLDLFQKRHMKRITVFQMEQRLFGSYKDIAMEGTPDVLGDFDGVPSVIDFKTTGYRYHKDKIVVAEQLYLYAHLAKSTQGYGVKQLVYFPFVKGMTPSIQNAQVLPFDQSECDRVLEDLHQDCLRMKWMEENNIFTRNRQSCIVGSNNCQYFKNCFPKV